MRLIDILYEYGFTIGGVIVIIIIYFIVKKTGFIINKKPDIYVFIRKKNGEILLTKAQRGAKGYSTTKFFKIRNIKGSYTAPQGKHYGFYKNVPIYVYNEGNPSPLFISPEKFDDSVKSEVIDIAVQSEIGLQLAKGLKPAGLLEGLDLKKALVGIGVLVALYWVFFSGQ